MFYDLFPNEFSLQLRLSFPRKRESHLVRLIPYEFQKPFGWLLKLHNHLPVFQNSLHFQLCHRNYRTVEKPAYNQ